MKKTVIIAGLGLIGGSMAKAFKEFTDWEVIGWNRTVGTAQKALSELAIDSIADDDDDDAFARCDLLIPVLYPKSTVEFLQRSIPKMKKNSIVVDLVGVKEYIINSIEDLALKYGVRFVGGHPMAGLAKAGYERSFAKLYENANMILVPTKASTDEDIEYLSSLFKQLGFGRIMITDKKNHDKMIAHTSQLAHIVSNSYVKNPISKKYSGFTGGSYKDMTRIACLNELVWSQLFLTNKEAILNEIEILLDNINNLKIAIKTDDEKKLIEILKQGRLCKENIDILNPNESE